MPSLAAIRSNTRIQRDIEDRLEQLKAFNGQETIQGKLKSQRGGNQDIMVKRKVDWPQNFVLTGTTKTRPSYDALSIFQWVAGFGRIIQEESNAEIKNCMLEYLTELMEDAQDFSWTSAKASHAVLLCRMEEGRVDWNDTAKIERIRRANAQRSQTQHSNQQTSWNKDKALICKFYQTGQCHQKADHFSGGRKYRHVCSVCFNQHPAKECKSNRQKAAKND